MKCIGLAGIFTLALVACGEAAPVDSSPPRGGTRETAEDGAKPSEETTDSTPSPASGRAPQTSDLFSKTFGDPKNPAVVFVHGGPGSNSFDFESSAAQALADEGFFVVAYDQRGCGRSPKGTMADYRYSKSGDDLDDVIFTLKLDKPVLLGHSFGGSIALDYLDKHPGRAKGVILAGSPINFPAMYRTILRASQNAYMSRFMKPKADELKALEGKMFPNELTGPFSYSTEDIVTCTKEMMQPGIAMTMFPSPGAMQIRSSMMGNELANAFNEELGEGYQQHDKVGYTDFTPLLTKHKAAVWAAYGADDGIFDEAQLSSIESAIGTSHFETIASASHWSFIDNRDGFVRVVASELNAMK